MTSTHRSADPGWASRAGGSATGRRRWMVGIGSQVLGGPLGYGAAPMIPQVPTDAVRGSALDDVQVAGRLIEQDRSVFPADDDVLDAGAVGAGEVDPGFDAEGHAGAQREVVA